LPKLSVGPLFRLGRIATPVPGGAALVSLSGSMFEYLMPLLVMRAPRSSLMLVADDASEATAFHLVMVVVVVVRLMVVAAVVIVVAADRNEDTRVQGGHQRQRDQYPQ